MNGGITANHLIIIVSCDSKEEANEKKIQNTFQIGLLSIITQKISVIRMLNTKIEKNINILAIHECINKKRTRIDRSVYYFRTL